MKKTKQTPFMLGKTLKVGALCAILLSPVTSMAASISFGFSGSVSDVLGGVFTQNGAGANGFSSSLPMSGSFTFNSTTADTNGSANTGRYNGTIQNLTVTVGADNCGVEVEASTSGECESGGPPFIEVQYFTGADPAGRAPAA